VNSIIKKTSHLWPITLLRVYTGVFFLKFGWGKIMNPNFMRPFLESVVLPNKGP